MLLGCTSTCTVEATFECPDAATTAANDDWALKTCTDRCGDGIYDGPFPEITTPVDRTNEYPTCLTRALGSPLYDDTSYTCFLGGTTNYADRILTEQCDTAERASGDVNHGCDRLCQVSTEQTDDGSGGTMNAWNCFQYYLGEDYLLPLEEPLFRTYCEWLGPAARRRLQNLPSDFDS